MPTEITYTQARANLAALCDQVASTHEPVIIRRRGQDVALVDAAELRGLTETAHRRSWRCSGCRTPVRVLFGPDRWSTRLATCLPRLVCTGVLQWLQLARRTG